MHSAALRRFINQQNRVATICYKLSFIRSVSARFRFFLVKLPVKLDIT